MRISKVGQAPRDGRGRPVSPADAMPARFSPNATQGSAAPFGA